MTLVHNLPNFAVLAARRWGWLEARSRVDIRNRCVRWNPVIAFNVFGQAVMW